MILASPVSTFTAPATYVTGVYTPAMINAGAVTNIAGVLFVGIFEVTCDLSSEG